MQGRYGRAIEKDDSGEVMLDQGGKARKDTVIQVKGPYAYGESAVTRQL